MKKVINLYNRYDSAIYLERLHDNDWILKAKDPDDLNYMRIGFTDDSHEVINFIDPSGGPFMAVGNQIDNKTITSIEHESGKFIITLEDESKGN